MQPQESCRLKPGTPVWVWVVQLARGRWWPGTVEALRTIDNRLRVAVRFECRRASDREKAPVTVGITTTAMRYLELRDVTARGLDQPRHTPMSLLELPEEGVLPRAEPQAPDQLAPSEERLADSSISHFANGHNHRNQ